MGARDQIVVECVDATAAQVSALPVGIPIEFKFQYLFRRKYQGLVVPIGPIPTARLSAGVSPDLPEPIGAPFNLSERTLFSRPPRLIYQVSKRPDRWQAVSMAWWRFSGCFVMRLVWVQRLAQ